MSPVSNGGISPEEANARLELFDEAMELAHDILANRGRTGARGATLFLAEALIALAEEQERDHGPHVLPEGAL